MWLRLSFATILLAHLVALTGCGFRPLYGNTASGVSVTSELSQVAVAEQRTRLGQLIRNNLLSSMSPPGGPTAARYTLEFIPEEKSIDAVVERNTDVSRRIYRLSVAYRLVDSASGKVVHQGKTFSHVAYDRVPSEFANIQAETNAVERAAHQVSEDIRVRVAAYFASS